MFSLYSTPLIDCVFNNTVITVSIGTGKYCPNFKYQSRWRDWCHDQEKQEKYKEPSRKTKRLRFTSKFINTFLESRSDEDEGYVI